MKYPLAMCWWALAHGFPEAILPAIAMSELIIPSARNRLSLLLNEMSIVSVTNIPGLSQARQNMFGSLEGCHSSNPQIFEHSSLADGTKRAALATEALFQKIPEFEPSITSLCPKFTKATQTFRALISEVSGAFASSMDFAEIEPNAPFMTALEQGQQLEHFIVYTSPAEFEFVEDPKNETAETLTIDMHVDEGLFIALVPPLLIGQKSMNNSGLIVQLKSGELRSVVFPDDSSVVFMMGDGLKRWMKTSSLLPAVPHAMKMSQELTRLWYGRMFLPPTTQFNSQLGLSFGMYRQLLLTNSPEAMVGCLAGGMGMRDSQCNGSDVHCWMKCYSPSELPNCGGLPFVCVSNSNSQPCAPDSAGCGPRCGSAPVLYCDPDNAMTMFMDGFASPVDNQSCVIFLFQGWIMDTRFKFFLGCAASLILGMFAEWLISLRRGLSQWQRFSSSSLKLFELWFYGCQAMMGYILMLLAMTYSVPIFFCVLLGLMSGHAIFVTRKSTTIASDSGTPCCEGLEHQMVLSRESDEKGV